MRTATMDEQKAALARPHRLARPDQIMNAAPCYHYEVRLAAVGNGPSKPVWRPRANRKEIGWDGFVDRGGSMRIFGSVLPLIDRHHNCLFAGFYSA